MRTKQRKGRRRKSKGEDLTGEAAGKGTGRVDCRVVRRKPRWKRRETKRLATKKKAAALKARMKRTPKSRQRGKKWRIEKKAKTWKGKMRKMRKKKKKRKLEVKMTLGVDQPKRRPRRQKLPMRGKKEDREQKGRVM